MTEGPYKLANDWRWVKLEEVAEIFSGTPAPQGHSYFENGQYPFVRVQDLGRSGRTTDLSDTKDKVNELAVRELPLKLAQKGTILFPKSGAAILTNSRAILGIDAFIVSHLAGVEVEKRKADPYWVYLWLCMVDMKSYTENPSYPSLRLSRIKEIAIPLPPLDEQRRIVVKMEALMERVREAKRLRIKAREDAECLMQSALGEVFIDCKKIGWEERCIADVLCKKPQYGLSKKAFSEPAGIPIIRMGNIVDGRVSFDNLKYVELKPEETTKYLLEEGDILFNRTNSAELVGKSAVYENAQKAIFASYLIRLKIDRAKALPHYIVSCINSPKGQGYIQSQLIRAIGQANLNASKIQGMPIPLPALSEQRRIMAYLKGVHQQVTAVKKVQEETEGELQRLERAILDRAFRGEL
jgi:type I restriction enzyme S subunit